MNLKPVGAEDATEAQPTHCPLFTPPRPKSLGPLAALLRAGITRDSNLLGLLPKQAYSMKIGNLGYSRRSIIIINDADTVRSILTDPTDIYPKSDLMVGALAPLVGDSIFVSSGDTWRKQRAMVAPAFNHMKLSKAFESMQVSVEDYVDVINEHARSGEEFSLDMAMSHLTADIICRTVFSTPLASSTAKDVFEAFTVFERSVAHVEIMKLIIEPAWSDIPHQAHVLEACENIRHHIGELVDTHMRKGAGFEDIATDIIAARDGATGEGFTRKELIDQLGVFFLAGHETTASALTWGFYVLATQPQVLQRIREETEVITGGEPIGFQHIRDLTFTRSVFKECLRLYPPITFIPRVAAEATMIGKKKIKKGAMIMIAPWVIHRHQDYWKNPDQFDAERFMPHRESEIIPNTYMPFGLGPRVCVGANFATIEATLILSRLAQMFDFTIDSPDTVRPVARLTTRPAEQIMMRAKRR
ncbi:cytochrome P450 [Pseudahrensia aquimaris]|uniref:Cytochrome P450 n=1 Tax=Pseudahrensia aquimaris TaxID=744461 RepID=A0ABW3FH59_9HYPH